MQTSSAIEAIEDLWTGSVARYHQREREEHRWEWVRFYDRMARLHGNLAASYTARAEALLQVRPEAGSHAHTRTREGDRSGSYPELGPQERE